MWQGRSIKRTLSDPRVLAQLRGWLCEESIGDRTALADRACEAFGFFDARGRLRRSGCLKALRSLEASGELVLPAPRRGGGGAPPRRHGVAVAQPEGVPAAVHELRGLSLIRVVDGEQRALWNELMAREHPRGAGPLVGCQLRYLVASDHGWLGAVGFAAAALQLHARDRWIGWDHERRERHLGRVVGLSRLLIRPRVSCRNLASHVLGRVLRCVGADWEAVHGYRPWLVETFVDPAVHTGASLRAANWRYLGDTRGRGRQDSTHAHAEAVKAVYVYALERDWRARLGVGPAPASTHAPLAVGEGLDSGDWAAYEFGDAPLGDKRLSRRLVTSAQRQAEDPMRAFTGVAGDDWAAVKGYYRLIDQAQDSAVTPSNILAPHRGRTLRRMQAQPTVLCVVDATSVNFSGHIQTEGLGVMGSNQTTTRSRGLQIHTSLALTPGGLPLGVLRTRFDAPTPRREQPCAGPRDKKSYRWIEALHDCAGIAGELGGTRLVTVMDREADTFALFDEQRRHPGADLLVRAQHNRRLADGARLFDQLRRAPVRGHFTLTVERRSARAKKGRKPAQDAKGARSAGVELRYERVHIAAPGQEPITLTAVHVRERHPPPNTPALEWLLLTTVDIDTPDQGEEVLAWYALRWRIEDWHRVLKSGCRIERLAHEKAERLERAIALRMVIAWRIMLMTLLGREQPGLPPELLFTDTEIEVLQAFAHSRGQPPPTTLGEAVRQVAILGGYLNRNNDPPPGHQLIWYGHIRLAGMCDGFALQKALQ